MISVLNPLSSTRNGRHVVTLKKSLRHRELSGHPSYDQIRILLQLCSANEEMKVSSHRTRSKAITWSCLQMPEIYSVSTSKTCPTAQLLIPGNRQSPHWMIKSKLFFSSVQQLLEQRLLQI